MINAIKTIVDNLLNIRKISRLEFGIVESINPLTIRIEQKKLLQADDLILSHLVKDYEVDIEVSHITDSIHGTWDTNHGHPNVASSPIPIEHKHGYSGRKKIKIYNGLHVDEKVVLIRQEGGQLYYVLDRTNNPTVQGEWI